MQIDLTRPDLKQFITEQVDAGHFPTPQAAVEALMIEAVLPPRPLTAEELRGLDEAQAAVDRGEYLEFSEFAAEMRKKYGCGK